MIGIKIAAGLAAALAVAISVQAREGQHGPEFQPDGTVKVLAFELPASSFLSPEAIALLKSRANPRKPSKPARTIQEYRVSHDAAFVPRIDAMKRRYAVDQVDSLIAGVRTRTFTPRDSAPDPNRVLINIHGGGFIGCEDACSQLESIPMAAVGGFKVVSVFYRMAPEAVFPAGPEDVAKVYLELLKTYKPQSIGIFGCSAGGQLTAQTTAYLLSRNIPGPGALGIFGAGAGRVKGGDSSALAPAIDGGLAPASLGGSPIRDYFDGTKIGDPIASPVLHLDLLAKFPPTLFLTSSRAADLSPAIFGHSQMVKAGVPGDLLVQDGLGHCFQYLSELPESRDAYQAVVNFFRTNLGK